MKIWTVDAFTDKPFTGNPAAVTIVDTIPSDELCQKIAAEMNLSETAFIKPLRPDHFHIRWFTPEVEVKLCGHATLASSHILFKQGIVKGNQITFNSLSGPLFVTKEGKDIVLDFPLQKTGEVLPLHIFEKLFKRDVIVNAVKADEEVIVELVDETLVRELKLDPSCIKALDCRTLIVTAKGKPPYDCVSRVYAPREGINEDPVTGSAHCKLADYWQQKLGKSEFLAYQASPRGGILGLQIVGSRVHLRGQAVIILEGTLKI
ncbi:PhzF family phenazine biosynthesis protein [Geitlerinema splendidum]|jgi:PhzF family phenazine biosynthesis protein|nr:PhzF family phenazine biosynthesis protein [Geitlerinema splendidum]